MKNKHLATAMSKLHPTMKAAEQYRKTMGNKRFIGYADKTLKKLRQRRGGY